MEFTGISIHCTLRQNWNGELFSKVNNAIKEVVGYGTHISLENCQYSFECGRLGIDRSKYEDKYIVQFSTYCNVSSDVAVESRRCQSLLTVLQSIVVGEMFSVSIYLDGTELVASSCSC